METSSLIVSLGFPSTQQVTRTKYRICWKLFSPLLTVQLAMEEETDISSGGVFSNQTPITTDWQMTPGPTPTDTTARVPLSTWFLKGRTQVLKVVRSQPSFPLHLCFSITAPRTFVPSDTKGVDFMPRSHTDLAVSPLPFLPTGTRHFSKPGRDRQDKADQSASSWRDEAWQAVKWQSTVRNAMTGAHSDTCHRQVGSTRLNKTNRKWVESKIRPHLLCHSVHSSHLSL